MINNKNEIEIDICLRYNTKDSSIIMDPQLGEKVCSNCGLVSIILEKEFTVRFAKKLAKYIPSKIEFKGNISKRKKIKEKKFGKNMIISNLTLFKNYILITVKSTLHFYTNDLELIFNNKFVIGNEEILNLNPIDNETIIFGTDHRVLVINFYEKKEKKITFEIIQVIKDTDYYYVNKKLYNGRILIGGRDEKYSLYEIVNKGKKKDYNVYLKLIKFIIYMQ